MEQTLINAIGSVGFPIVACIYVAWMHYESEKRHSDERVKMTEALTKMSVLLEHIKSLLEKAEHE